MSSSVTGSVGAWPCTTMPSESPTSSTSTPARSASRGEARVVGGQHRDASRPRRPSVASVVTRHARRRGRHRAWAGRSGLRAQVVLAKVEELAPAAHRRRRARAAASMCVGIVDEVEPLAVDDQQRRLVVLVEEARVGVGEARQVLRRGSTARSRRRAGARARPACPPAPAGRSTRSGVGVCGFRCA